jgi:hypothetical protein
MLKKDKTSMYKVDENINWWKLSEGKCTYACLKESLINFTTLIQMQQATVCNFKGILIRLLFGLDAMPV